MSDYYQLPPPEKKRSRAWLYLLLLLLFLLGLAATWWSLRLKPGEIGVDPMLTAMAAPPTPLVRAQPPAPTPIAEVAAEPAAPAEEPPISPEAAATEAQPEPPPPPPLFSDVRWRETARFTGADAAGRPAEFTAYVLVGDETWTFARADSILAAGLDKPVETAFAKLELGTGICELSRVVAIGAASVEGTSVQNTFLSHTRGHALRTAVAANLPCDLTAPPVSVLDLGYSRAEVACPAGERLCPALTAPQRPIAMILADAEDPDTDISAALQSGITAHEAAGGSVLPGVRIADYSAFDLR